MTNVFITDEAVELLDEAAESCARHILGASETLALYRVQDRGVLEIREEDVRDICNGLIDLLKRPSHGSQEA